MSKEQSKTSNGRTVNIISDKQYKEFTAGPINYNKLINACLQQIDYKNLGIKKGR